jgi:ATP-binding cassette, subfamily B, bacterial HlyB/CyaB
VTILTTTECYFAEFLTKISLFSSCSSAQLAAIVADSEVMRYRIGQSILVRETMPAKIVIVYTGQVRVLGDDRRTDASISLEVVGAGATLGWLSLLRGVGCEAAIASTEVIALTLPAQIFWQLFNTEPEFARTVRSQVSLTEIFELLSVEYQRRANATIDLKQLAERVLAETIVINCPRSKIEPAQFSPDRLWLISAGKIENAAVGERLPADRPSWRVDLQTRVVGVPLALLSDDRSPQPPKLLADVAIVDAPDDPATSSPATILPFVPVRGRGEVNAPLACFQMLAQAVGVPFRRDAVRRVLEHQLRISPRISLQTAGAIAEMMGLRSQLIHIDATALPRVKLPALIYWQESIAVLYGTAPQIQIATPAGSKKYALREFVSIWGEAGQVLTVAASAHAPTAKFGLGWFLPVIGKHRQVLIQVLLASCFVQLFGLANPIVTQVIIDKVLGQRSLDTLDILGVFLLGVAVFEALLTSLRTYLFTDTTNRIDLTLGAAVIDHLLRLPLRFFDRRRVGELAGRLNELENIRQFLTGTALTVVIDAIFSVIYIAVMLFYSWQLTLVTLGTVPLFALLTICISPIVRRQLEFKAERYADAQSYLVEVLSGMQTIKAQHIELKSRWQWQERYTRYISAGFKSVLTFSTASSISGFLNKFSGLLLLWVGAHLVLANQLTLGELIAFRIIAGYVTSPLLRLIQIWQSFQETALSIQRLGDILDAAPEVDERDRHNISLPPIAGNIEYRDISFGFNANSNLQLLKIDLTIPAGTFVGIVGQSGSGKSTLTKLLPRLYEPTAGLIAIDGYDISKVELSSLRSQIGIVLQDSLLFNGTIHENIALTSPDASSDEVMAAAKIAAAHDFIMALPQGYNTNTGERGAALSGGQRQRIAIARAVLQNPRILILDEATSALDYNAEQQVCRNLHNAFKDRTILFITHRLNTIKHADHILMMERGSIAEQGTHDRLMDIRGRYYCLFQQQESIGLGDRE